MTLIKKIDGIHSVDFKIEASGHGCINWNGRTALMGDNGEEVKNHSLPKMRGFSNKNGKVKAENNYEYKVGIHDIDMKDTPMYISQNCLKHHIFKSSMPFHLPNLSEKHAIVLLSSLVGLLRGFAITASTPLMKKSPIFLEDLVDVLGKCNFEVLSTATSKTDSKSGGFYSKTTVGETSYVGYGSINIEELQFISCDGIFGRSAVGLEIDESSIKGLAAEISKGLRDDANSLGLDSILDPVAEYNECWVKVGGVMEVGEAGILLNNDAMLILVECFKYLLSNLYIHQARGYMQVNNLELDFNDNIRRLRIKQNSMVSNNHIGNMKFAKYYRKGTVQEIKNSELEKQSVMPKKSKKGK